MARGLVHGAQTPGLPGLTPRSDSAAFTRRGLLVCFAAPASLDAVTVQR